MLEERCLSVILGPRGLYCDVRRGTRSRVDGIQKYLIFRNCWRWGCLVEREWGGGGLLFFGVVLIRLRLCGDTGVGEEVVWWSGG